MTLAVCVCVSVPLPTNFFLFFPFQVLGFVGDRAENFSTQLFKFENPFLGGEEMQELEPKKERNENRRGKEIRIPFFPSSFFLSTTLSAAAVGGLITSAK